MRVEDLEVGDVLRTVAGELRLLVHVEEHKETKLDAWLTWLQLETGKTQRYLYGLREPISPSCEVIRGEESLKLS